MAHSEQAARGHCPLVVILLTMSTSSFQGTYAYRELVRSISSRAHELELATDLASQVSDLRVTLADLDDAQRYGDLKARRGRRALMPILVVSSRTG